MRHWLFTVLLAGVWSVTVTGSFAQTTEHITTFPGSSWEVRTPEEVGLDPSQLVALSTELGGSGLIIKDGYQVFGWGSQTTKREWMSAAKPVTSTLLMFAVEEGLLSTEHALVGQYVQQEFGQPLRSKDSLMTFFHLAHMTSGYALPTDPGPGSRWGYNDYAIKLYSKLLATQVFGASLDDVVRHPSRLGALQFQDGTIYSSRQDLGVHTTPRDFARIGWFWLNRGYWNGTQLLPDKAFDQFLSVGVDGSTVQTTGGLDDYLGVGTYGGGTDQTSAGPGVYGFNFWVNADGELWPDAPHDTYQANGGWNRHALTIIPSLKMVATWTTSKSDDPETFAEPMNVALKLLSDAADVSFSVPPGWSQVSVPVKMADMSVSTLLDDPAAVAFEFSQGRFLAVDSLEVGKGYVTHSQGVTSTLRGEHVLPRRVAVEKGWNFVGTFHNATTFAEISSDPPGILDSLVIDVESDEDALAMLTPGQAYWVRSSQKGHLVYANDPDPSSKRPVTPASYRKRRGRSSGSGRSPFSSTGSRATEEGPW